MGNAIRGQCERHQLPLDARGQCELCRLDAMASKPPPSRTARWIIIGGALLLIGAAVFAFGAARESHVTPPRRGVQRAAQAADHGTPTERAEHPMQRPAGPGRSISVPPPPHPAATNIRTAPTPPPPPTPHLVRSFTEEDGRAALNQVRIEMYATSWCGSCRRAREYLSQNGIRYTEYDIDADQDAKKRLAEINPRTSVPTFQIDDIVQTGFSPESLEYKINQAVRKRLYP